MKLRHGQAVALMVVVTFLWATAGVVTRQLHQAQSFEITFWRSFFTFVSLCVILPLWQGPGLFQRMRQEGWILWASGAFWAVMFTAFMVALSLAAVANVLVTMAAGPLLTALVSKVLIGHQIPRRTWFAIVVAAVGIAWIFGRQLGEGGWLGSAVAFAVPVAGALNWTLVQHSNATGHAVDLVPAVLIGGFLSAAVTLPLAWPLQTSAHDVLWLAGLGLGQLAVPCVLSVLCARALSATEVSLLALLEVLFGIAMAWWGAHEAPQPYVLQGGALVLGALMANEWLGHRQRKQVSGFGP